MNPSLYLLMFIAVLFPACVFAAPVSSDIGCPASLSADNVYKGSLLMSSNPPEGRYKLSINKGDKLIGENEVTMLSGRATPITVFLTKDKRDTNGEEKIIPATHTDGLSAFLYVNHPKANQATLDYNINTYHIATLVPDDPNHATTLQIPIHNPDGDACGSVTLALGQSQTFALGSSGLTATIKRLE